MTELTRPLAASAEQTATQRVSRRAVPPARTPSFTELVYAHLAWWRAVHRDGDRNGATEAYRDALASFEERHGEIVNAYWCTNVESAVALTEKPRRVPWGTAKVALHRESDWATKKHPDIARELHRCDELAVRAKAVLTGVRQRICLELVMASARHLLSLVDSRAAHADEKETAAALAQERAVLARAEAYYCHAANGQAQIVYFAGMVTVAAAISAIAGFWLAVDWASPVAALIAGAVGAVVSVIQRINSGDFELDYDVGRPYAFFLGGLRPLIGGAFALVITFAFTSGILHLPLAPGDADNQRLALLVVSFLAGFSERWAQDTLATALPVGGRSRARGAADSEAAAIQTPRS